MTSGNRPSPAPSRGCGTPTSRGCSRRKPSAGMDHQGLLAYPPRQVPSPGSEATARDSDETGPDSACSRTSYTLGTSSGAFGRSVAPSLEAKDQRAHLLTEAVRHRSASGTPSTLTASCSDGSRPKWRRFYTRKHKAIFAPHVDTGDHVIVVNAAKIVLSANKADSKVAYHHSGYPGGLRAVSYASMLEKEPEEVVRRAVRGMLPKGTLGRQMLSKLKVYAGPDHPHAAQMPKPRPLSSAALGKLMRTN